MSFLALFFSAVVLTADTTPMIERIDGSDPVSDAHVGTQSTWFGPDGRRLTEEDVLWDEQGNQENWDFLLGSWEGILEYLDYGDDETLVTLPTGLACRRSDDGSALILDFSFTEPDRRTVISSERLFETEEGVNFGGLWQVLERFQDPTAGINRLEMVQDGEDNGREASLRTLVVLEGDQLTITKFVRYAESNEELRRNQYRLKRTDG